MDNDEDLIVVDDVDDSLPPATPKAPVPGPSHDSRPPPTTGIRSALRRRKTPPLYAEQMDDESPERGERKTRSSTYRSIGSRSFQPKLKLKLSEKAAAQAPGMSFLGAFDRELDSDEEDLVFEEQFVLRMPAGEDCEKLRKMVASREISPDVWFKFKGAHTWPCLYVTLHKQSNLNYRFPKSSIPYRQQFVFCEISRPAMYYRVAEDFRQQTDVQSCRHMSSKS